LTFIKTFAEGKEQVVVSRERTSNFKWWLDT